jgi:ribosome-associated protein
LYNKLESAIKIETASLKPNKVEKKVKSESGILIDAIVEAIQEKKGKEITIIDLRKLEEAVCSYFIICHTDSTTQVRSILEYVVKHVKSKLGELPWKKEGVRNLEWVLIDYVDVVVHIFYKERRIYYNLEQLWSDGDLIEIPEKV